MLKGKESIMKWFDMNKAPYWKLCQATNINTCILAGWEGGSEDAPEGEEKKTTRTSAPNNLPLEGSRQRLIEALDTMEPGRYFLKVSATGQGGKSWMQTQIDTSEAKSTAVGAVTPSMGAGYVSLSQVEEMISKEKRIWDADQRVIDLTRQFEEFKKGATVSGVSPGVDRFFAALAPHAPQIISGILPGSIPAQVGVSGFTNKTVKERDATPEEEARFSKAVDVLSDKTPDFVSTMEKLAKLAQEDPEKYKMALSML